MAVYKPPAGARIIDRASGSLVGFADGKTYYDLSAQSGLGGDQYGPQIGEPIQTTKTATQLNAEAGSVRTLPTTDVFGNTIGDQAGTVYKNQALASQQGATQYATNGQFTDALGQQLSGVLSNLNSQGLTINPNKQLGPSDVAEFLRKAENEIDPYYREQLKVGREGYLKSVGYDIDTITQNEQQLERKYGQNLRSLGESAAERGFAQSGMRRLDEQELAQSTQEQINQGRRALGQQSGQRALEFAGKYGSRNLPQFSLGATPQVGAGEGKFSRQGQSQGLYNIDPNVLNDIVGSQEKERATSIRDLGQFYEGQYRLGQTIPQTQTISTAIPQVSTQTTAPRTLNIPTSTAVNPNYFLGQGETIEQYKRRLNLTF